MGIIAVDWAQYNAENELLEQGVHPNDLPSARPKHPALGSRRVRETTAAEALPSRDDEIVSSWDRDDTGSRQYVLLTGDEVDDRLRTAAHAGHRFAVLHHGLPSTPPMRFYRAETFSQGEHRKRFGADWLTFRGQNMGGHADRGDGSIGIRLERGTTPQWACEVAAHEVRHLAQSRDVRLGDAEGDATAYGEWAANLLMDRGTVAAVHVTDRNPWDFRIRAGYGDVLIAHGIHGGVFSNVGHPSAVNWRRRSECPVSI